MLGNTVMNRLGLLCKVKRIRRYIPVVVVGRGSGSGNGN